MAALAEAYPREFKDLGNVVETEYEVEAGETIYQGGLVMIDNEGYAKPASDLANHSCVGFADEDVDNTSGADGAVKVRVLSNITGRIAATGVTRAMLQTSPLMYMVNDNEVDNTDPGQSIKAGVMVAPFISTTEVWLHVPPFGMHTYGL